MRILQYVRDNIKENKSILLTLTLLVSLAFIYGCQCEGSIGNNSKNVKINATQSQSK